MKKKKMKERKMLTTAHSDIYRPTERATAMGWYLSGTLIGPALGPFIG